MHFSNLVCHLNSNFKKTRFGNFFGFSKDFVEDYGREWKVVEYFWIGEQGKILLKNGDGKEKKKG